MIISKTYEIATSLDRLGPRNDKKEVLDFARTVVAYCIWLLAICQKVQSTFSKIAAPGSAGLAMTRSITIASIHLPPVIARSKPVSRYTERATKQSR